MPEHWLMMVLSSWSIDSFRFHISINHCNILFRQTTRNSLPYQPNLLRSFCFLVLSNLSMPIVQLPDQTPINFHCKARISLVYLSSEKPLSSGVENKWYQKLLKLHEWTNYHQVESLPNVLFGLHYIELS